MIDGAREFRELAVESMVQSNAYRQLAERSVLALHMLHAGPTKPEFADCRQGLCADWHALKAKEESDKEDLDFYRRKR